MLILEPRLNTETNETTMVLDGLAQPSATTTVSTKVYWRWYDDDTMEFQFLGETVPGSGSEQGANEVGQALGELLRRETTGAVTVEMVGETSRSIAA